MRAFLIEEQKIVKKVLLEKMSKKKTEKSALVHFVDVLPSTL